MPIKGDKKEKLTPKLRFPEFNGASGWTAKRLGDLVTPIKDRVGNTDCTPYTVTSGVGLVSQEGKFGRTIAGNSLKNYILLRHNDFAYNKSATKAYPEGYIARYTGDERAAVPNSIFTCFRPNPEYVDPAYLDYLFASNLHGRWLKKFITVGARAHGSLNVNDGDLLSMPVPLPTGEHSNAEQRKIAACLTSLDEWIAAQGRRLKALRAHKKGLMQELFPRAGETSPRLRFPQFRNGLEWKSSPFNKLYTFPPTNTFSREELSYDAGTIKNVHYGDIHTKFAATFRIWLERVPYVAPATPLGKIKPEAFCQEGDMIFADSSEDLADVGKSIEIVELKGEQVLSGSHTILARRLDESLVVGFGAYLFQSRAVRAQIEKEAQGTKVVAISPNRLASIDVCFPIAHDEQQQIAACLYSLDTLVAAEIRKLGAVRAHKKGLMQRLFPSAEGL